MTLMDLLDQVDDMPIDIGEPEPPVQMSVFESTAAAVLDEDELDLIRKFRCLDERGQAAVLNVLNYEYDSLPGEKTGSTAKEA